MNIPTMDELNRLTAVENHALLLRTLMTSDLSFHYMLFKKETLRDIINVGMDLMKIEGEDALPETYMEIKMHHQILRDYISQPENVGGNTFSLTYRDDIMGNTYFSMNSAKGWYFSMEKYNRKKFPTRAEADEVRRELRKHMSPEFMNKTDVVEFDHEGNPTAI